MTADEGPTVMLCTDYLPPGGGGVEAVVEQLAVALADRGVDIVLFSLGDGPLPDSLSRPDVEVVRASTLELTDLVGIQSRVSTTATRKLARAFETYDPDVVHVHNRFFFTSHVTALVQALRCRDVPLVVTLHLGDVRDVGGVAGVAAGAMEQTLGRFLLGRADAVVAVSEAVGRQAIRLGAPEEAVHVVYNGVDTEAYRPRDADGETETDVLFVGRLVRNKGPHLFLRALPEAFDRLDRDRSIRAHVVGQGPMEDELREIAADAGVADHVTFHGFVEDMPVTMAQMDMFCRPSLSEGMPLTVLEAMAAGLPPVVSRVAGVPEVVEDGATGRLLADTDPETVGAELADLASCPEETTRLGRNAREYVVANHSWERRGERVLNLYRGLLGTGDGVQGKIPRQRPV